MWSRVNHCNGHWVRIVAGMFYAPRCQLFEVVKLELSRVELQLLLFFALRIIRKS